MRSEVNAKSELGLKISAVLSRGELVSDDITNALAIHYLENLTSSVILDGYPRTLAQAQFLTCQESFFSIPTIAINIVLDKSVIVEKLLGRKICKNCGLDFNTADVWRDGFEMPAILPHCNCPQGKNCEQELVSRADDTEEIIFRRLNDYELNAEPLLEHFRKLKCLRVFQVKRGLADTNDLIDVMLS